jgi:quercetin dioxygenase-like cupin family protein
VFHGERCVEEREKINTQGDKMFGMKSVNGYVEIATGIKLKTLNYGENSLMSEFLLEKGALLPEHAHPHEQTGYLVSGKLQLTIGDSSRVLAAGDSWNVPSGAKHKAAVLEDAVAIEVFTPCRQEYLKFVTHQDIVKFP